MRTEQRSDRDCQGARLGQRGMAGRRHRRRCPSRTAAGPQSGPRQDHGSALDGSSILLHHGCPARRGRRGWSRGGRRPSENRSATKWSGGSERPLTSRDGCGTQPAWPPRAPPRGRGLHLLEGVQLCGTLTPARNPCRLGRGVTVQQQQERPRPTRPTVALAANGLTVPVPAFPHGVLDDPAERGCGVQVSRRRRWYCWTSGSGMGSRAPYTAVRLAQV